MKDTLVTLLLRSDMLLPAACSSSKGCWLICLKVMQPNLLLVVAVCLIVHIIPSQIDIFVAAIMDIQASLEVLELWW